MEHGSIRQQLARMHAAAFGWAIVCCRRDEELARDVLQQAYCRILAGEAKFAGRSDFRTWVFGVIRHVTLEEIGRQTRHRLNLSSFGRHVAHTNGRPRPHQDWVEQDELADRLHDALARLSSRQREVLHLTFYQQLTIEQAASVLQISVGSARTHFERGKSALHRILSASSECQP